MGKITIYIILAVVVIIAGGIVVTNMNKPAAETSTDNSPTATQSIESSPVATASPVGIASSPSAAMSNVVTITSSGYSPAILTVKSGTTVTFKNESGKGVWIASDPHPSHTDLPGFDAEKAIPNGSSYSFTFSKVGSWGYHDHLNSSNTGTIVVQ